MKKDQPEGLVIYWSMFNKRDPVTEQTMSMSLSGEFLGAVEALEDGGRAEISDQLWIAFKELRGRLKARDPHCLLLE